MVSSGKVKIILYKIILYKIILYKIKLKKKSVQLIKGNEINVNKMLMGGLTKATQTRFKNHIIVQTLE